MEPDQQSVQPSFSTPPISPSPQPKQKKGHPVVLTIVVILLIAIAAVGGYFGYQYTHPSSTVVASSKQSTTSATTSTQDALISFVKNLSTPFSPANLGQGADFSTPDRSVTGYDFLTTVTTDQSYGFNLTFNSADSSKFNTLIAAAFPSASYTKRAVLDGSVDNITFDNYDSNDYSCAVHQQPEDDVTPPSVYSLSVTCAPVSAYITNAAAQAPFFAAIPTADKHANSVLYGFTITNSPTKGYKTATAQFTVEGALVGGAEAVFYQTPDQKWNFVNATQDEINCSDYSTQDAKNAFVGTACSDSSGNESKVTL